MNLLRSFLALALALAGGGALAQSVAVQDSAFQRFLINTTGVGQQTVAFGTGGQPIPQAAGYTLAGDGGPGLKASATGVLRNASGGSLPVAVTGRVTPSALASVIGRAVPLLSLLAAGVAIYDLAKEYGYDLERDASGAIVVRKPSDNQCQDNPCREYYRAGTSLASFGRGYYNIRSACLRDTQINSKGGNVYQFLSASGSWCSVARYYNGNFVSNYSFEFYSVAAPVGTTSPSTVPSSVAELQTAIQTDTSIPVTSAAARAADQARQLLNEPLPLAQPQVTGPATSPGSTSTTTKPDGSTVTITQTYNHTYTGPTINTTTTTVTSTVPSGGGPVQTEETVQTPDPVQQEPEPFVMPCGVPGSPPCAVKVDETGVPTTVQELSDPQDMADQSIAPIDGVQDETFWPSLPEVTFDFALPTACSPLSIPAFSPFLEQIDVCEFQPMFHSIMELVWILGALFGAISLFWRNSMNPVPA